MGTALRCLALLSALIAAAVSPAATGGLPPLAEEIVVDEWLAVGPFSELLPDTFLTFQVAFVMGDGFEGQNGLKSNAVNAQRIFDGDYFNLDGNADTGTEGKEKCVFCGGGGPLNTIDDNCDPTDAEVSCDRTACTWIDADCENPAHTCTGMSGRESQVNWIGVSPPPAPPPG